MTLIKIIEKPVKSLKRTYSNLETKDKRISGFLYVIGTASEIGAGVLFLAHKPKDAAFYALLGLCGYAGGFLHQYNQNKKREI